MMLRVRMIPSNIGPGGFGRAQLGYYLFMPEVEWVQEDPDLVDVHGAAVNHRIDIYHNHGIWPPWETSGLAAHQNAVAAANARKAHRTIVPSVWTQSRLETLCDVKAVVIPNGLDFTAMDLVRPDWFQRHPQIWGQLDWSKPTVLWLRNRIDTICNPTHFSALALKHNYNFISTVPAEGAINVGLQSFDEALSLLASCNALVNTVEDSFGYVTLEALALGIPVVGLKLGALSELLDLGGGYVAESPAELSVGLEWCLKTRPQASQEGLRARYDWDVVCAQTLTVYREVICTL